MATIAETIRGFRDDPQPDPLRLRRFLDGLRFGSARLRGVPVVFDYEGTAQLFERHGIDRDRFEELCQMADDAHA